jgi:predicted transcriptional regulator
MTSPRPLDQLGRRERQIMDILFRLGRATAAEVQAELNEPVSNSAVRGMLRLLEEKGQLRHEQHGVRYVYLPARDPEQVRRSALRNVVGTFFNDSASAAVAAMLGVYEQQLTDADFERLGPPMKVYPPIRGRDEQDALWAALADGTLDTVGSDHSPMSLATKGADQGFWAAKAGAGDVGTLLPILLSEGVNRGRLSLRRLVEVCSRNPAMAFGLYPRKGAIAVGADADLVAVDLSLKRPVRAADLDSICDWSPYEGMELTGWPVLSLLRGRTLLDRERLPDQPSGTYLARTSGSGGH